MHASGVIISIFFELISTVNEALTARFYLKS